MTIPIFETPDEPAHFLYANDLAAGEGLPVLDYARSPREYHQPPLYYWLVAGMLRWFDTDGYTEFTVRNPHAAISDASTIGNKNVYLHDPRRERWPFRGLPLAVHVGRVISIGLSAVTVVATYMTALQLFCPPQKPGEPPGPRELGLAGAAASVVAFNPQFLFISGALNNDSAVTAICSLALWAVVAYYGRTRSLRWVIWLGVLGGLSILTKTTGFAVVALILIVVTAKAIRQDLPGRLWLDAGLVILLTGLIGGWWYARNALLYADPLLSRYIQQWLAREDAPRSIIGIVHRFEQSEISFWGTFGWLSITWDEWIYQVLRLWTRLCGLGLLVLIIRRIIQRFLLKREETERIAMSSLAIILAWVALVVGVLTQWILVAGGLQGRLLFPAISALALLLMAGWTSLVPRQWELLVAAIPVLGLAALATATPFITIAPVYASPTLLTSADLPSEARPVDLTYVRRVKLVGYQVEPPVARPGEKVDVTLYWQALDLIPENFSLFVHLFGRDNQRIGTIDTYPGLGNYPTSRWQPGEIIQDNYPIRVAPDAAAPTLVRVSVGWYDFYGTREGIHALDSAGRPTTTAGTFKLIPQSWPRPEAAYHVGANFNNVITLVGYDIDFVMNGANPSRHEAARATGQLLNLTLYWQCQTRPPADFTVFVHVLDEGGNIVTQMDRPPLNGDYPTSVWDPGEVIVDSLAVPLTTPELLDSTASSRELWLRIGLYRPEDGSRLPVLGPDGQVIADSATSTVLLRLR